ncbi:MAG: helix-turn-helix domain-containing protein [Oscillospiraceae bacterium]|nr:helix-turn-helix domain-containing protein [Oscillospiraceae bacterium]
MLGDHIKALRKQKGMTQQELAERLHVVRQTVSKWEKNLSVPDAAALQELAEALDVTVAQLLGGDPEPETEAEPTRNDIAVQLARYNDLMAVKNHRAERIWKAVKTILLVFLAFVILLFVLNIAGLVAYTSTYTSEEMTTEIIEVDQPDETENNLVE